MGLLSVAIWLPIVAGAVLLALGRDEQAGAVRWLALVAAIGLVPLAPGFLRWCPAYLPFGISTCKTP